MILNMTKTRIYAFTLIEILVVATIIALLAAGATISYSSLTKQSRDAKRKADLEQIRSALEMYRSNNNQYISTDTDNNCSSVLGYLFSPQKYLESIPNDPKSNLGYYYRCRISQNDYTLGAYLESGGTTCPVTLSCGLSNCNYCLGPYGKK